MKSQIEIQLNSDVKQLQINSIKTILGIGDPNEIKKFKHKTVLAYHPDKKKSEKEKLLYTPLFKAIDNAVKMDEDPSSAMEWFTQAVEHKYSAEKTTEDITYTKTFDQTFTIPLPIINQSDNLLNNVLKEMYQLTDEDLVRADQQHKDYLTAFVTNILTMKKPSPFSRMFLSNKQIENDLLFLVNETQNDELIQQVNLLKLYQINYDSFDSDGQGHTAFFCKFITEYLKKNEFKSNMYKIYLNIACKNSALKSEELKIHWLYKQQTYADLAAILLKSPVWLALCMTGFVTVCAIIVPLLLLGTAPIALFNLCVSSSIATAAMLGWAASIAIGVYFEINPFEIIISPITPYATFIDRLVNSIFTTKPCYTTELANSLSDLNDQKVRNQAIAGKTKFGLFNTNDSSNEKDFDNKARESVTRCLSRKMSPQL